MNRFEIFHNFRSLGDFRMVGFVPVLSTQYIIMLALPTEWKFPSPASSAPFQVWEAVPLIQRNFPCFCTWWVVLIDYSQPLHKLSFWSRPHGVNHGELYCGKTLYFLCIILACWSPSCGPGSHCARCYTITEQKEGPLQLYRISNGRCMGHTKKVLRQHRSDCALFFLPIKWWWWSLLCIILWECCPSYN